MKKLSNDSMFRIGEIGSQLYVVVGTAAGKVLLFCYTGHSNVTALSLLRCFEASTSHPVVQLTSINSSAFLVLSDALWIVDLSETSSASMSLVCVTGFMVISNLLIL